MDKMERGAKDERLDDHSLPGTNQAGKEATSGEDTDRDEKGSGRRPHQGQLGEHSLPGTNQAAKPMKKPSAG